MATFVWAGPSSANWQTASDWNDVSDGINPATRAPGSLDTVSILSPSNSYQFIGGTGAASSLTLTGNNAFLGTVAAAFASMSAGTLAIEGGATLAVNAMSASGEIDLTGAGARLSATNSIELAGGTLSIGSGLLQARTVVMDGFGAVLSVASSGTAEIGPVTGPSSTAAAGALTVDQGATLSVSNTSSILPSALLGAVIDNGSIVAAELDIGNVFFLAGTDQAGPASSLSGTGTVEASSGGTVEFGAAITGGALTIVADAGSTLLFDSAVAAGSKVSLAGAGDVVQIGTAGASSASAFQAVISGFAASDALLINGVTITSVAFQPGTGSAAGTLSLLNGTSTVDTILISGSFISQSFAGYAVGASSAEIVIAPGTAAAPSAGTAGADQYVWIGPVAGDWNTATNWTDTTASQATASVAPGSLDVVTINGPATVFRVISGLGNASSTTFNGQNLIVGALATNTLANTGVLEIAAGATITATQAALSANVAVAGTGASFVVGGTLAVALGTLTVTSGASARLGAVTLAGTLLSTALSVDATGTMEIGSAGGASAGALTVDAGATLSVTNTSSIFPSSITGAVRLNGLVSATELDFGNSFFSSGLDPSAPVSSLSGIGSIEALANGTVEFGGAVLAGSVRIQADAQATLRFDAAVGSGNTVVLAGEGAVVQIGGSGATNPVSFAATISGFDASDVLLLNGGSYTSASYASGTLNVMSGTSLAAAIPLAGFTSASTFAVIQTAPLAAEIVLSQAGNTTPGAGTSTQDQYVWVGGIAGSWGTAANWEDASTAQIPAALVPGSLDIVTISSTTNAFRVIQGAGKAASLALIGNNAIIGVVSASTVTSSGSLLVAAGGLLTAAGFDLAGASVSGTGATLSATGGVTLESGVLSADQGGLIRAGSLVVNGLGAGITVSATGAIEIGGAGVAHAGALAVDPGATLSLTNTGSILPITIQGSIVLNGRLVAAQLDIGNQFFFPGASSSGPATALSGTGTIEALAAGTIEFGVALGSSSLVVQVDAGATLLFDGNVSAGVGVILAGDGTIVQLGTTGAANAITFAAGVTGFGGTDVFTVSGPSVTTAQYVPDAGGASGTLSLGNSGGVIQTIKLLGNYAGQAFAVNHNSVGQSQVSETTACFASGTMIETARGAWPVERLRVGDRLLTRGGAMRAIVWIGHRTLRCERHSRPHDVWPVRVRAHAFAQGKPRRDLWLSPDHAVFHEGRLMPVRTLLNGASVTQERASSITYFHVELADHDIIFAEGLEVESYLDTGNRSAFANGGKVAAAHPDFSRGVWAARGYADLATEGPAIAAARAMLLSRLPNTGFELSPEPDVRVTVDEAPFEPHWSGAWMRLDLPDESRSFRLISRVAAPAEVDPHSNDRRRLGVAVLAVRLDGIDVALNNPSLLAGWHTPERELRWTDGNAAIATHGSTRVEMLFAVGCLKYPVRRGQRRGGRVSAFAQ